LLPVRSLWLTGVTRHSSAHEELPRSQAPFGSQAWSDTLFPIRLASGSEVASALGSRSCPRSTQTGREVANSSGKGRPAPRCLLTVVRCRFIIAHALQAVTVGAFTPATLLWERPRYFAGLLACPRQAPERGAWRSVQPEELSHAVRRGT
jgi:hypothetical protein